MRLSSYLQSAKEIVVRYDGAMPFAAWLKSYFRDNKKFGSRDRKLVTDLCFCYFRLGGAFLTKPVEERLVIAQFICHAQSPFVAELKRDWMAHNSKSIEEKLDFLEEDKASVFPFLNNLSPAIDINPFSLSHLIQPDLFLRIRPRKNIVVKEKLDKSAVVFSIEQNCVRLPNMSKLDEVLAIDREAVIQDKSSQQSLNLLVDAAVPTTFTAWDCCAASGGKSILLHDHFPKAQLTVSDIRESIIHNLRGRFKRAGITSYQSFVADVSLPEFSSDKEYDVIICDAPCTGSGTWSRTPEQLHFFLEERIHHYTSLQKRIACNASKFMKTGGYFLYITCSVFKAENEDVVDEILRQTGLRLMQQTYYKGYTEKADTLFAALFSRQLN